MNIYHNLLLLAIYGSNFFVKAKLAKRESDDVTVKCSVCPLRFNFKSFMDKLELSFQL